MPNAIPLTELASHVGETFASEAVEVTQEMIDGFADATGDHQWIHVDPARAATGPFGTTIAHGYLTLSLVPRLLAGALEVTGVGMGVNYGLNRCRFPAPVPSGSKVAAQARLAAVDALDGGALQATVAVNVAVEGAAKPSCVAEVLLRYYPG
jgi:acyl dehydratase